MICDNASTHKAPKIVRWLQRHHRFTLYCTPTYARRITMVRGP
jgi:hypothetical protein